MTHCIKTGAGLWLANYGYAVPADIFEVGDRVLVAHFNRNAFRERVLPHKKEDCDWILELPDRYDKDYFWQPDLGIVAATGDLLYRNEDYKP